MRHATLERGRVAIQVQQALAEPVVGDAGVLDDRVQSLLRVAAEPQLVERVDACALGGALAQELERPTIEIGVEAGREAQRLVAAKERRDKDLRRPRRGPGVRVTGRDQAGVAEARLVGGAVMPLDDGYLMAVLVELIRSGQPDHAGTDDDDLHVLSRCHDAVLVGWFVRRRPLLLIAAIVARDCGVRHRLRPLAVRAGSGSGQGHSGYRNRRRPDRLDP